MSRNGMKREIQWRNPGQDQQVLQLPDFTLRDFKMVSA